MDRPLLDLFHRCTVRLTGPKGSGTGFFVAPGLVLTSAHVVEKNEGEKVSSLAPVRATWLGQEVLARVVRSLPAPYPDLALLEMDPKEHPCVFLDDEILLGDPLAARAYTAKYPGGESATLMSEGRAQGESGEEFLKLKEGQILAGFSGAPLLNLSTLGVCGLIKSTRDKLSDLGGFAIPTSVILRELPEIAEWQASFHAKDRRWAEARELQLRLPWDPSLYLSRTAAKFLKEMAGPHVPLRLRPLAGASRSKGTSKVPPQVLEEDLSPLLHEKRLLLAVGPSGSGKTWLCKRLVVRLTEELAGDSGSAEACVPIYVEVGRYRGPYHQGLRDLIALGMKLSGGFDARISTAEAIEEELARGRFLLLFDGLNEIGSSWRTEALREIIDLCEVFPKVEVLVTCQSLGFSEVIEGLIASGFLGLEMSELVDREIEGFLKEFGSTEQPVDAAVWSKLPRIPLILKLLLDAPERLPSDLNLPELLDRTVGFMTRKDAVFPQENRPKPAALEKSLSNLAYRALLSGRVPPLPKEFVEEVYRDQAGPDRSDEVPLAELWTVGLVEQAAGEIRFAHEIFFQYFIAIYLRERWQEREVQANLEQHLEEARWQEPFAFAVALMKPGDAMAALHMALDRPLLAARCFHHLGDGATRELADAKKEFLQDQRTALAIAATDWPKVFLLVSFAAIGILSVSAALGWTSPPAIYVWLSSFGELLRPHPNPVSTRLKVLGMALGFTAGAGALLDIALRLYERRALARHIDPIFQALVLLHPRDARAELARLTADLRKRPLVLEGVQQALFRAELQVALYADVLAVVANHRDHEPHEVLYALEVVERRAGRATEEDIDAVARTLDSPYTKVFKTALRILIGIHDSRRRLQDQVQGVLQQQSEQQFLNARRTMIDKALSRATGRSRSWWSRAQRTFQGLTSSRRSGLASLFRQSIWLAFLTFLLYGLFLTVVEGLALLTADS